LNGTALEPLVLTGVKFSDPPLLSTDLRGAFSLLPPLASLQWLARVPGFVVRVAGLEARVLVVESVVECREERWVEGEERE
jgi:hypothetical protein